MRVLVTWGSKLGGTEGIAGIIGEELRRNGIDVVLEPAAAIRSLGGFDAAVIGGALYANRWHPNARRLVARTVTALRRMPVWFFSSGPLDQSADSGGTPPVKEVAVLMDRVGAVGHATFGGRLPPDAKGFPAASMARNRSGDWRNPEHIRLWASDIARALPNARPRTAIEPPGRSVGRLLAHGVAGWALCAALMGGLLQVTSIGVALALHAIAAPLIFVAVAYSYFGARGAREPLRVATAFTVIVAALDALVVAGLVMRDFAMFASLAGTWLPLALIFLATWATGAIVAMIPAAGAGQAAVRS